jgi:hypothetical protein
VSTKRKQHHRGETFLDGVLREFGWLIDQGGMAGPEISEFILMCVTFHGSDIDCEVCYDTGDMVVSTSVRLAGSGTKGWVSLWRLVLAAEPGSSDRFRTSAQTPYASQQSLASQSGWLRRLYPRLVRPEGASLLREA